MQSEGGVGRGLTYGMYSEAMGQALAAGATVSAEPKLNDRLQRAISQLVGACGRIDGFLARAVGDGDQGNQASGGANLPIEGTRRLQRNIEMLEGEVMRLQKLCAELERIA